MIGNWIGVPVLNFKLLGFPQVLIDGLEVRVPTKKALGLLAYLALAGPQHREHLARLCWGDMRLEGARRNLRQEFYRLSKTPLGPWLEQRGNLVGLRDQHSSDANQFHALLEQHQFAQALELYRGPLLQDVQLVGAARFDAWLESERENLAEQRHDALSKYAARLAQEGALREALAAYLECLERDELQEHMHREVMRLHAKLGDRGAALTQFRRLSRALRREVNLEPLPETVELAEQIRADETLLEAAIPQPLESNTLDTAAFVGRQVALEHLRTLRGFVLLTGEPGIGKSRLALEATRFRVSPLWLRGHQDCSGIPFYPITLGLRGCAAHLDQLEPVWRREVARLLPELAPEASLALEPTPEGRARFLEGIVRAVLALIPEDGVIVLDDLQWFDASSLECLGHLVRRSNAPTLIATARAVEMPPATLRFLEAMRSRTTFEQLALEGLKRSEMRQLMTSVVALEPSETMLERLQQLTAGNPLYALELARIPDWATLETAPLMSTSLRDAVLGRVDRLGAAVRRTLESASLLDHDGNLELITSVSALSDWEALNALELAHQAQLLEPREDGYRFAHDLVRETLEKSLSKERKRLLHRKFAEALHAKRGSNARIADHFERADEKRRAVTFRIQAAHEASDLLAYHEALEHHQKALDDGASDLEAFSIHEARATLWSYLDDRVQWQLEVEALSKLAARLDDGDLELRAGLAKADFEFGVGRFAEAAQLTEGLLTSAKDAVHRARLRYRLGASYLQFGQTARAKSQFSAALSENPNLDAHWRGRFQYALAAAIFDEDDLPTAQDHVEAALKAYRAARDEHGEVESLNLRGHIAQRCGDLKAQPMLEQALERARTVGVLSIQRKILLNLAANLMSRTDYEAALPYLEEGLALARDPQDPQLEASYLMHLASLQRSRGDLGAVLDLGSAAFALSEQLGMVRVSLFNRLNLSNFLLDCGDIGSARRMLDQARSLLADRQFAGIMAWCDALEARCDLCEGRAEQAMRRLRALEQLPTPPTAFQHEVLRSLSMAHLRLGRVQAALACIEQMKGSLENEASALSLQLEATKAHPKLEDLDRARVLLQKPDLPPTTKLYLYAAFLAVNTDDVLHREAKALINRLAQTLDEVQREHFLKHWVALVALIPNPLMVD